MSFDRIPKWSALAALAFFVCAALAVAAGYAPNDVMPNGYYKDLGVNIIATANIDASVRDSADLIDAIGWAPWDNGPAFAFNPMTSYAILVPIAKLAHHDAIVAVKIAQILQFVVMWAGAAWLYAVLRGRFSVWAAFAGLIYAVLPNSAIQIRGNADFAFLHAFMPVALAASFGMVDRAGVRALPLAGFLCSIAGLGFAIEYYFLTSAGMYAMCALRGLRSRMTVSWAAWTLAGGCCSLLAGAFVVLPSLDATQLFREPVSRIAEIGRGDIIHLFSETFPLLLALVPQEAAVSPTPEFNVSSSLPIVWAPALLLWTLAAASFFLPARYRVLRVGRGLAVLAICIYLSLGTNVLLGSAVWGAIARVPVVQLLRTPDRFIALPELFVPLLAMGCLEALDAWLPAARASSRRLLLVAVACGCAAAFVAFDGREHVLSLDRSFERLEPAANAANAAVHEIGGRTLPLAFVDRGSVFDSPYYGAGSPFERYGWDLMARFGGDGIGATGILSRAGVRSLITSPDWIYDVATIPDFDTTLQGVANVRRVTRERGIAVLSLSNPSPDVTAVRTACFFGDVGLLDRLAAAPALRGVALVRGNEVNCGAKVIANADAAMRLRDASLGAVPAGAFGDAPAALRDADYPFIVGTNVLAPAWYRDAIDGSQTVFPQPAVQTVGGFSALLPHARGGRSVEVMVRLANHVPVQWQIHAGKRTIAAAFPAHEGLRWESVPIGTIAAKTPVRIAIASSGPDAFPATPWHGVAIDAIGLRDDAVPAASVAPLPTYVAVDLAEAAEAESERVWLPAGNYVVHAYARNGSEQSPGAVSLDGHPLSPGLFLPSAGSHAVSAEPSAGGIALFEPFGRPKTLPSQPAVAMRSRAAWDVEVREKETLEAAVLDDGNWELVAHARAGAQTPGAVACDLVNTCFPAVEPGAYTLRHRWPRSIVLGLTLTLSTGVAGTVLAMVAVRKRGA